MSRPRVLFVGPTRYRLPLPASLQKKFDSLERELDYRVLARAADATASSGRFELVRPARPRLLDGALFYLSLPLRTRRAIRSFRPDAVVAEDPYAAAAAVAARALARRPGPRVIAEAHGDWHAATRLYGSPVRRLLAPLADAVAGFGLRRADAVRAVSPYIGGLVERATGAPPAAEFTTYSDLEIFAARPPSPLPERPAALFVGVLELYKNVDGLAAAWRLVAGALPEARLVVVGQGSRCPLVEQLAVELPGRVEHVPLLEPDGVARRMDASTVLVLPSRSEGLPRVALESFARGRGVVGARAGGIPDLVRDGVDGLLVEPDDVEGLAAALVRVLSDRELAARLGRAAAERYREWHTTADEFAARVRALVETTVN